MVSKKTGQLASWVRSRLPLKTLPQLRGLEIGGTRSALDKQGEPHLSTPSECTVFSPESYEGSFVPLAPYSQPSPAPLHSSFIPQVVFEHLLCASCYFRHWAISMSKTDQVPALMEVSLLGRRKTTNK